MRLRHTGAADGISLRISSETMEPSHRVFLERQHRNVASVRVSNRLDLPGGGKGIEMHTSSRIWLLIPPSDEEFISWLHIITNLVKTNLVKKVHKII